MFNEADLIVLGNRSTSQTRVFAVFDEKQVFPNKIYAPWSPKPALDQSKHEECDYETEDEHVVMSHKLMLEDLHKTIQFYVD